MTSDNKYYDIIGDIHGCNLTLIALLEKLGYSIVDGIYQHPTRNVIFLGDFIDRNSGQREVIAIVRPMIESGTALSVMGNHEFNAIAYATFNSDKNDFLRKHDDKNFVQHEAFLDVYENDPDEWKSVIDWFKTLPLWLELDGLNIIHACWDKAWMNKIMEQYSNNSLTDELLINASTKGRWEFDAVETLLKGKEIPLQDGHSFNDKDGHPRHHIRIKWWDSSATTYKQAFMGPATALTHIPDDDIVGDHLIEYGHRLPPVFLGHYWMEGELKLMAPNIACVDYSVAKPNGQLAAYCWQGEQLLNIENFVTVDRIEA
ncbi:MAG: metallophosphoesterase [Thiohalomonadales bacterium]